MTTFKTIPYWSYVVAIEDEDLPYKLRDRIREVTEVVFPSREAAFASCLRDMRSMLDLEDGPFQWPEFHWSIGAVLGIEGWAEQGVHPAIAVRIFQLEVRED